MAFATIVVPAGKVTADLTNFPVMIRLSLMPSSFWSTVSATGGDIRATTSGDVELPIDVVMCDPIAKDGAVFFLAPSLLAASANTFKLTWDGTSTAVAVTAPTGRNAVWADYHRVYFLTHLDGFVDHSGHGTPMVPLGNVSTFLAPDISPETNSHEGVAWDGTHYYTTDVNAIRKWTSSWTLVATNSNPCAAVGGGTNHLGDPEVVGSILYVPVENYTNPTTWSAMRIARFSTTDLSFISAVDISAQFHEAAALAYCPDDGYLYLASFADGSKLLRFNLTTLAYVSTLTLSTTVTYINGLTYWLGLFWAAGNTVSTNAGQKTIRSITPAGGVTAQPAISYTETGYQEGLSHTPSSLLHLFSTGNGQGKVATLTPRYLEGGGGARWYYAPVSATGSDDTSHTLATGLTRYTQWTIGTSVALTAMGGISHNFTNYGVAGETGATNRAAMGYRGFFQFGLWNSVDGWLNDSIIPETILKYRLHDVHDGTASRKLYRDGALVATDTTITAMPGATANALYLGITGGDLTQPLLGSLGFVYLRPSVLSAAWIAAESATLLGSLYTIDGVAGLTGSARLSQLPLEVAVTFDPTQVSAKLSQLPLEIAVGIDPALVAARVSQLPLEVAVLTDLSFARVSQVAVEVLFEPPNVNVNLSQAAVEVLFAPISALPAKLSQVAVEVLYLPAPPTAGELGGIWMGEGGGGLIWIE